MSHAGVEIEIKLAVPDAVSARRLLRKAGFQIRTRRSFESNVIFDTPEGSLRAQRKLLRLRSYRKATILTLKGPPSDSKTYKTRFEVEVHIDSPGLVTLILEGLGLSPQFAYEKYRTQYYWDRGSVAVFLDETPIGTYLEIEGQPRSIDAAAKALEFLKTDYIAYSYGVLYRQHCRRKKITPKHMVFSV